MEIIQRIWKKKYLKIIFSQWFKKNILKLFFHSNFLKMHI